MSNVTGSRANGVVTAHVHAPTGPHRRAWVVRRAVSLPAHTTRAVALSLRLRHPGCGGPTEWVANRCTG